MAVTCYNERFSLKTLLTCVFLFSRIKVFERCALQYEQGATFLVLSLCPPKMSVHVPEMAPYSFVWHNPSLQKTCDPKMIFKKMFYTPGLFN